MLVAKVGLHDAYTISLRTPNGKVVHSIPAGTYSIVVHDYSKIHNFALGSQTENKRIFTSGIPWVGTKTYTRKAHRRQLRVRLLGPLPHDERHVRRDVAAGPKDCD